MVLSLTACTVSETITVPKPLENYKQEGSSEAGSASGSTGSAGTAETALDAIAGPVLPDYVTAVDTARTRAVPTLGSGKLQVNVDGLALPAFIDEVFGTTLGLNFSMPPELASLTDQVTLRATEPQSPADIYLLAVQVLEQYGVGIRLQDNLINFFKTGGDGKQVPLLVSGRALPDVPLSHRPIFQLVPLNSVRSGDVSGWLTSALGQNGLTVLPDVRRNAVILRGSESIVREALKAVEALDQPFMRGRNSLIVRPYFIDAEQIAKRLVDVLSAEGYGASSNLQQSGSIIVLPISEANQIILFAADDKLLEHARSWIQLLDKPTEDSGKTVFIYKVQNTTAESISATINQLLGHAVPGAEDSGAATDTSLQTGDGQGRIVIDETRNSILFSGVAAQWYELLDLIKRLDQAPKQVLIEVTIAEVTLNDQENFGVEWLARGNQTQFGETFTSKPSESLGGSGLSAIVLNSVGQAKVALNAFASDSRVNLLSTPRILVQSGETADIDVGTEVPIITSSAESTETQGRITQTIQYRKTGIILSVSPVVHSGNRVDLQIRQEVSEALPISAGGAIQTPSIFNRRLETTLSLEDGGSVILGGLISSRSTDSESGVPYLKNLPFLGALFKSKEEIKDRTEMIMLIVPYVIENDGTAQEITRALTGQLEWLR